MRAFSPDSLFEAGDRVRRTQLMVRWRTGQRPLPVCVIRQPKAPSQQALASAPPWHDTGEPGKPFDFTGQVRRLLDDIVQRTPEFARLDTSRILISATQARGGRRHGLQARVTPLRFEQGRLVQVRNGAAYQVQRYFLDDHEFLYVLTFCLPRFLDQLFDDKLVTLFHELQHIDPTCNGDLRRHAGRCKFHATSRRHFDRQMTDLARAYLQTRPDPRLHAFLRLNFAQLQRRHGAVTAIVVPRPKVIPAAQVVAARRA